MVSQCVQHNNIIRVTSDDVHYEMDYKTKKTRSLWFLLGASI